MSGSFMLYQFRTAYARLAQVMSGQVSLRQVRTGYVKLGLFTPG